MSAGASRPTLPPAPAQALSTFGDRLDDVRRYASLLADAGVVRGLLGPREIPELWDRHLLNCATLSELIPADSRMVDVGSGAGLPGLVVAIRRPDLRVDLVESLARRCTFLTEAIELLDLGDRARVVRGRAEDARVAADVGGADVVTARAVAPLERLVRWCLPLVRPGGELLAIKGERAADEVREAASTIRRVHGSVVGIEVIGNGKSATHVVRIVRQESRRQHEGALPR